MPRSRSGEVGPREAGLVMTAESELRGQGSFQRAMAAMLQTGGLGIAALQRADAA